MRTYTIELRVDFDEDKDNKKAAMDAAVKSLARQVLATALLLSDKREPKVTLQYDDFWSGNEQLELTEEG